MTGGLEFTQVHRGDGVRFDDIAPDRNDGLVLWDGQKLVQLSFDEDEYGALPSTFLVTEFPTTYFQGLITHNSIIWLNPKDFELVAAPVTATTDLVQRVDISNGQRTYHLYTPDLEGLRLRWVEAELPLRLEYAGNIWENPFLADADHALYDAVGFERADQEGWDLEAGAQPLPAPSPEAS